MMQINSKIGIHKIRLSSVDSTNNFAAKLIKEGLGAHGSVILAENQTCGRGQRHSEWQSESAKNILTSFIFEFPTLDSSSLFDSELFTRQLEEAFIAMKKANQNNSKLKHIYLDN